MAEDNEDIEKRGVKRKKKIEEYLEKRGGARFPQRGRLREGPVLSREYRRYRREELFERKKNLFEKLCALVSRIYILKCPKSLKERIEEPIEVSSLRATSDEVWTLTLFSLSVSFFGAVILSLLIGMPGGIIFYFFPPFVVYTIITYPQYYADVIRIKAGNETVKIILYMVIYLSLNPVYDKAISFAAQHCKGPLGMDLRKILWNLDMGVYTSIKEALGEYSQKWSNWNEDFVSSLSVLQGIELESSREARQRTLKKSLEKVLTGTYSDMKEYTKDLRNPVKMLYFIGLLLPVLGLIMFPLVSIFLTGGKPMQMTLWVGLGYTIILPAFIWWFMHRIVSRRPSAFTHSKMSGGVAPKKYLRLFDNKIKVRIILVSLLIGLIIMIPGIFHYGGLFSQYSAIHANYPPEEAKDVWAQITRDRYSPDVVLENMLNSITVVWGIAFIIISFTLLRSYERKKVEDFIRKIEEQFEVGLFQLSDTLEENIPIEVAISYVLKKYRRLNLEETEMYSFFRTILKNMRNFGMTFQGALFDEERGVLKKFPSSIIHDVMTVLSDAAKKGPKIVSLAASNVVDYLESVRKIEETIKDILDEIISSLQTQSNFIAPFICGVVASTAVLIVQLLRGISGALQKVEKSFNLGGSIIGQATKSSSEVFSLIRIEEVVPPTLLQLILGIYLIEIIVIISVFLNGINRGFDEVSRDVTIGKNLTYAVILYSIVAFVMIIFFKPIIGQVSQLGG